MHNIILATIDCFRYDRCGFTGHHRPTTPTLDSIANQSLIFDRAYATGPYTTESFPGIISGKHSYNGSYFGSDPAWKALDKGDETLASFLSDVGYESVATLSNPHLTEARNFSRGFDRFRNLRTKGEDAAKDDGDSKTGWASRMYDMRSRMRSHSSLLNPYTIPFLLYRYKQLGDWPTVSGETVVANLIDGLPLDSEPFFGWTHLMDLHAPIHPSRSREGGLVSRSSTLRQFMWDAARASRIHQPRYDTMYDSTVRYVDQQLSTLISTLKEESVWDNTILIVTGDHGEVLWDRDEIYGHPRHHLYDDLLHVPLLVRIPDGDHRRVDTPFSLAWLHELVAQLLELDAGEFPTESGVNWLDQSNSQEAPLVVSDTLDSSGHSIAVRDKSRKIIDHRKGSDPGFDQQYPYIDDPVEFHYESDPGERNPSTSDDDLRNRANGLLTSADSLSAVGDGFDRETEQRLQDLGYKM